MKNLGRPDDLSECNETHTQCVCVFQILLQKDNWLDMRQIKVRYINCLYDMKSTMINILANALQRYMQNEGICDSYMYKYSMFPNYDINCNKNRSELYFK